MTTFEKNLAIKNNILDEIRKCDFFANAIQIGDFEFALPTKVENEDRYCVIALVAKSNKKTKTCDAFDPYYAHDEYMEECKRKVAEKLAKAAKKAKKA